MATALSAPCPSFASPAALGLSGAITAFRQLVFPSGTFPVGRQAKVEEDLDKWRRPALILAGAGVLGAFQVSLCAMPPLV